MKSLNDLNEAEKLSIKRRKSKGTPLAEIAEIIGTSVGVVKEVLNSSALKNSTK